MKLYYATGSCSLSPHIILNEAGLPFEKVRVDLRTRKTQNGDDFLKINPNGYVPALELDSGEILTEGVVIIQYLADQVPGKHLIPACGSMARYRALEWLNFIATEIHKSFSPLFNASMPAEAKQFSIDKLVNRFKWVDTQLATKQYALGDTFSVVDAYLFTVASWCPGLGISLDEFKNLTAYLQRVKARPTVQEAMKGEGLQ